jgi:cell wall-associated NlpC family hydrolase
MEPWAADYIGIPYVSHGRDIATGVDCWGLVAHVMRKEYGFAIPDYDSLYSKEAAHDRVSEAAQVDPWTKVPFEDRVKGDGLWFTSLRGVAHVGVFVSRTHFLHCNIGVAASLGDIRESFWSLRMEGVYRWEGPSVG